MSSLIFDVLLIDEGCTSPSKKKKKKRNSQVSCKTLKYIPLLGHVSCRSGLYTTEVQRHM